MNTRPVLCVEIKSIVPVFYGPWRDGISDDRCPPVPGSFRFTIFLGAAK